MAHIHEEPPDTPAADTSGTGSPSPATAAARTRLSILGGAIAYVLMGLACLWQPGAPQPWSRLDLFSGGLLALVLTSAGIEVSLGHRLFASSGALGRAAGMTYDRATLLLAPALAAGDALVFLDYGRWRLTPVLELASLQTVGLALAAGAMAWIARTDAQLFRHFEDPRALPAVMTTGPYRYVRHPRYAGILGVRVAYGLTLASAIAWGLAAVWLVVLVRRIRLEEAHLLTSFGESYEYYAAHTARLIPGVY